MSLNFLSLSLKRETMPKMKFLGEYIEELRRILGGFRLEFGWFHEHAQWT